MNPPRISARHIVCLVMLLATFPFLPKLHTMAAETSGPDICRKWPQNRLAIDVSLRARRFELEASGPLQQLPRSLEPGARRIFHRTFILSLDAAEPIALFRTSTKRTCAIARDSEKAVPLMVPVFFVGSDGRPAAELRSDAERAVFDPSSSLSGAEDFADVRFHLKKAGWSFSSIRPFFVCGLPGVMLCGGSCPGDMLPLTQLLVDWALKEPAEPAVAGDHEPAAEDKIEGSPGTAPSAQQQTPMLSHGPAAAAPGPATVPPKQASCPPNPPAPAPSGSIQEPVPVPVPSPQAGEKQGGAAPAPAPKDRSGASEPLRKLVLVFENKSGAGISGQEILQIEGSITILGATAVLVADGLALELPESVFEEAKKLETLKKALRHYEVLMVKPEETRVTVTVKPLFIRASNLTIKIAGGGSDNVSGCDLSLEVFPIRRLGPGWSSANLQSLRFHEVGPFYALELPANTDKNALLIDTAEDGIAARLSSAGSGCKLEPRPNVTAEEIRSGSIVRALPEAAGQILIALVSTDSDFSDQVGAAAAEGFWASSLSLVSSVSEGAWEKRLLARAQPLAFSQETKILEGLRSGKLAAGQKRDEILKMLIEGSRPEPGYLPGTGLKPVPRFELDQALGTILGDAGLEPRDNVPRLGLLLISGGVDPADGYFCRHPVGDAPAGATEWVRLARRVFVLEVWSDTMAKNLEQILRARPAENAPPGIYTCNISGAGGVDIALYGVLRSALAGSARAGAFAYLTARANSHLRP